MYFYATRLVEVLSCVFTAFLAVPKTGIPTTLVDLAATYTSALRLQLTLKGLGHVHTRARIHQQPTITREKSVGCRSSFGLSCPKAKRALSGSVEFCRGVLLWMNSSLS